MMCLGHETIINITFHPESTSCPPNCQWNRAWTQIEHPPLHETVDEVHSLQPHRTFYLSPHGTCVMILHSSVFLCVGWKWPSIFSVHTTLISTPCHAGNSTNIQRPQRMGPINFDSGEGCDSINNCYTWAMQRLKYVNKWFKKNQSLFFSLNRTSPLVGADSEQGWASFLLPEVPDAKWEGRTIGRASHSKMDQAPVSSGRPFK